jgi:hypothetical protein
MSMSKTMRRIAFALVLVIGVYFVPASVAARPGKNFALICVNNHGGGVRD